jgi:hypothetical protein
LQFSASGDGESDGVGFDAGRQHEGRESDSACARACPADSGVLAQQETATPVAAPNADFTAQQQAIGDQIAKYTAIKMRSVGF